MAKTREWTPQDSVALRDFFKRVPEEVLLKKLREMSSCKISSEILLEKSEGAVARLASMAAGMDEALENLIVLSELEPPTRENSAFRDMT